MIFPAVGSHNLKIVLPIVDFPQPLSPTRPNTWDFEMDNDTSSTALMAPTVLLRIPLLMGKYFFKCSARKISFMKLSRDFETGDSVPRCDVLENRFFPATPIHRVTASRVKSTAWWGSNKIWDIPVNNAQHFLPFPYKIL